MLSRICQVPSGDCFGSDRSETPLGGNLCFEGKSDLIRPSQIKSLRLKSCRSWRINDTASAAAVERLKKLELFDKLTQEGCSRELALEAIGWSRATWYRWRKRYREHRWAGLETRSRRPRRVRKRQWSRQHEQQVLHLRQRHPLWGKRKLWKVLNRDHGLTLSISTVGRILKRLRKRGLIKPAAFYLGRVKPKRQRVLTRYARRWPYRITAKRPGELMQLDHMSVNLPGGVAVKEFKATCPITGLTVMRVYRRATSHNTKHFLSELIRELPFPLHSLQVNGGSEFQDVFELYCQTLNLPLYVLPPRRPKYNGCVERANGTSRYEFYPFYQGELTVEAINQALRDYQYLYNHYRPHDRIGLETPMSYYQKMAQAA